MTLRLKPVGRGFRLVTTLQVSGGHMDRALTVAVGSVFTFGGIRWRVLEVLA